MDAGAIREALNDEQRAAVCTEHKRVLVFAGAGSGKTRVLTHRVAWLNRIRDIPLSRMLVLTFTNNAANEMRARLGAMLSRPVHTLWIHTFHGFCNRLLQSHHAEAGLPANFQILDSDDQRRMLKRMMAGLNVDPQELEPKDLQSYINRHKEKGVRADGVQAKAFGDERRKSELYKAYEDACRQAGVVDFAELLLATVELLNRNERVARNLRERFMALLVDEFQDTSELQFAICRLLEHKDMELFVVGDDDQSIYGWRGARPDNIFEFEKLYPGTQTCFLGRNYRSTGRILAVANALIEKNEQRKEKTMRAVAGEGEPVVFYTAYDEREEAEIVAQYIGQWRESGRRFDETAVLYRSHMQSRTLEEALRLLGIPYRIRGGLRFYERAEVKDALAYLSLALNLRNGVGFERVVNTPVRGVGAATLAQVRAFANGKGLGMWDAGAAMLDDGALSTRAAKALRSFYDLVGELTGKIRGLPLHEQVREVITASGLYGLYADNKDMQKVSKRENLDELVNDALAFEEFFEKNGWRDDAEVGPAFIEHAALDADARDEGADEDRVQMMTLHAAKGLEFPFVMMTGMEDGLLPHKMSMDEDETGLREEEERRLCYVGITRARERLVMLRAKRRHRFGQSEMDEMSRFVDDVPQELFEWRPLAEARGGLGRAARARNAAGPVVEALDEAGELARELEGVEPLQIRAGQRVRHDKFGDGVVTDYDGSGNSLKVRVSFGNAGTKWLAWGVRMELLDH